MITMIKNNSGSNSSNFIVISLMTISVSIIIFSLAVITTIETTYANHTENHLNNSLVDVTITGDDIPDALLEDLKRGIVRDMKIDEQKAFEKTNNSSSDSNISQLQTTTTTTETIKENPKGKIILTSHKYSKTPEDEVFDELPGQVKNVGNGTAEDVSIIFTYYDNSGNAIGNDNYPIYADILNPGQKSSFQGWRELSKTPDMAYYDISLSWYNSDGTQEYIQDVDVIKDPQEKIPPIIVATQQENNENDNVPFFNTATNGKEITNLDSTEDEEDNDDEDDDEDNEEENDNDEDDDKKDDDEDDD
jgi:hypothetical protein